MKEQRHYGAGHTLNEWRDAVKALMNTAKAEEYAGPDAPGHSHRVQGKWDATGQPCDWCAAWNKLRAMLAGAPPAQAEQPEPQGWIPISERLPVEQDMYLGMLREDNPLGWTWERPVEVAFGYLLHNRQRFSVFDAWAHENVDIQDYMTHWMSLPAAPKLEGGAE